MKKTTTMWEYKVLMPLLPNLCVYEKVNYFSWNSNITSMHSSRMHTAQLLTYPVVSISRVVCLYRGLPIEVARSTSLYGGEGVCLYIYRGESAYRGVCLPHAILGRQTPLMNRTTDKCKNVSFPQLRLRALIIAELLDDLRPGATYH